MLHSAKNDKHLQKVRKLMSSSGYGGSSVKSTTKTPVSKGDNAEMAAEIPKRKAGGCAEGGVPAERLDKRKRGGAKKGSVHVNVIVPQGGKQPVPMPIPGGMPPGGMAGAAQKPPMPPMQAKTGGKIMHEEFGAGGGQGRLAKIKEYGEMPKKKDGGVTSMAEDEGKAVSSKNGNISVGS